MILHTKKSSDFANVAVAVFSEIENFKTDNATVAALYGELGAGKTTLVQHLVRLFHVDDSIQSPTFVIMKLYPIKHEQFDQLIHVDAYRIEKIEEMQVLGLHKLIADPKNLILIEWPENISDLLPDKRIDVKIEYDGEGRKIELLTS